MTIVLSKIRYEWMHICFQYFKTVSEFNSKLFRICLKLILCGEKITDEDMLEKTFYASNVLLQQQYCELGFKRYSILISCLLMAGKIMIYKDMDIDMDVDEKPAREINRGEITNKVIINKTTILKCTKQMNTMALVGERGSGKSTVISLIQIFYNPESGQLFLNGVETRKFNKLAEATNVATEEKTISATRAANAHNFISGLPQGYEPNVGVRGI
ncbi:uncharacterized protein LOC111370189 [Olea europaea var. sylvestris]|uniref:uncharacterized protein LOC111370189 n=1 Tax=Olea europaea var. sylvestris TaxID=158386 RepID=UPI000C1D3952|nr:uncharacterized protein LOC111370189 [Olea europaea var. sylvestris]